MPDDRSKDEAEICELLENWAKAVRTETSTASCPTTPRKY
jgi:hypothetical protein